MKKCKIDQRRIIARYKQKKLLSLSAFMKNCVNILSINLIIWSLMSLFLFDVFSYTSLMTLILPIITILLKKVTNRPRINYIFGWIITWIIDFRCLYSAFWRVPEFSGLIIAVAMHIFYNAQMDIIATPWHGYLALVFHTFLWCTGAVYSKTVKNYPPSDVVFILVTFVFSQLIWYKNRVKNEYKEIERKILLETSQANIHNLVNAVPEGIVVIDQNQKILMKNEAFQKLINDTQFDDIKIIKKYQNQMKQWRLCSFDLSGLYKHHKTRKKSWRNIQNFENPSRSVSWNENSFKFNNKLTNPAFKRKK